MNTYNVQIRRINSMDVNSQTVVCHIDEFELDTIHALSRIISSESEVDQIPRSEAEELIQCDYIKFTDYFRVTAAAPLNRTARIDPDSPAAD